MEFDLIVLNVVLHIVEILGLLVLAASLIHHIRQVGDHDKETQKLFKYFKFLDDANMKLYEKYLKAKKKS